MKVLKHIGNFLLLAFMVLLLAVFLVIAALPDVVIIEKTSDPFEQVDKDIWC